MHLSDNTKFDISLLDFSKEFGPIEIPMEYFAKNSTVFSYVVTTFFDIQTRIPRKCEIVLNVKNPTVLVDESREIDLNLGELFQENPLAAFGISLKTLESLIIDAANMKFAPLRMVQLSHSIEMIGE